VEWGTRQQAVATNCRPAYCDCTCDFYQDWRAANALQKVGSSCRDEALPDADLQRVISAWNGLPEVLRSAILALTVG
jgi:hypothetical protein